MRNISLDYTRLANDEDRRSIGEVNDCAVLAVSIATGIAYRTVHARFKHYGRKDKTGTPFNITQAVVDSLGFKLRAWTSAEKIAMLQSYPAKGKQYITTHHPVRFAKQWAKVHPNLLMRIKGHILACKNSQVIDWSSQRSLEVREIYEVTPR
jgi:hypothetical protein